MAYARARGVACMVQVRTHWAGAAGAGRRGHLWEVPGGGGVGLPLLPAFGWGPFGACRIQALGRLAAQGGWQECVGACSRGFD